MSTLNCNKISFKDLDDAYETIGKAIGTQLDKAFDKYQDSDDWETFKFEIAEIINGLKEKVTEEDYNSFYTQVNIMLSQLFDGTSLFENIINQDDVFGIKSVIFEGKTPDLPTKGVDGETLMTATYDQNVKESNMAFLEPLRNIYNEALNFKMEMAEQQCSDIFIQRDFSVGTASIVRCTSKAEAAFENVKRAKIKLLQTIMPDDFVTEVAFHEILRSAEFASIHKACQELLQNTTALEALLLQDLPYNSFNGETIDKAKFKAYFNLINYDNWLALNFSDLIQINPDKMHKHPMGTESYFKFTDKGDGIRKSYTNSEEIKLSDNITSLVKMIINATPMFTYNETSNSYEPTSDERMSSQAWCETIAIVKNLAKLNFEGETDLQANWENLYNNIKANHAKYGFSQGDIKYLESRYGEDNVPSIERLITDIRRSPLNLQLVFTLLANKSGDTRIIDQIADIFPKIITTNNIKMIGSIYQGFFNGSYGASMVSACKNLDTRANNYYLYCTQLADSVFKGKMVTIENSNGIFNTVTLSSQKSKKELNLFRSLVNLTNCYQVAGKDFNTAFKPLTDLNDDSFKLVVTQEEEGKKTNSNSIIHKAINEKTLNELEDKYEKDARALATILKEKNENIEDLQNGSFFKIKFKENGIDYTLHIDRAQSGQSYYITRDDNDRLVNDDNLLNAFVKGTGFKKAFEALTGLHLHSDSHLQDSLENSLGAQYSDVLLKVFGHILSGKHYQTALLENEENNGILTPSKLVEDQLLDSDHKKYAGKFDDYTNAVDLISPRMFVDVSKLTDALYLYHAKQVESSVKDADGNTLNECSTSRLWGNIPMQWQDALENPEDACHEFSTIQKHMFKDLVILKDVKLNETTHKKFTECTAKEQATFMFLYNFVVGMYGKGSAANEQVYAKNEFKPGNGQIGILTSVNSDKTLIGQVLIDITTSFKFEDGEKSLQEIVKSPKGHKFLCDLISKELGNAYKKQILKIVNDYKNIFSAKYGAGLSSELKAILNQEEITTDNAFDKLTALNKHLQSLGKPAKIVQKMVYDLNQAGHHFELIDQIHYCGDSLINPTTKHLLNVYESSDSVDNYLQEKEMEMIASMLDDDFQILRHTQDASMNSNGLDPMAILNSNFPKWYNEESSTTNSSTDKAVNVLTIPNGNSNPITYTSNAKNLGDYFEKLKDYYDNNSNGSLVATLTINGKSHEIYNQKLADRLFHSKFASSTYNGKMVLMKVEYTNAQGETVTRHINTKYGFESLQKQLIWDFTERYGYSPDIKNLNFLQDPTLLLNPVFTKQMGLKVTVHPALKTYNTMSYLFSQQFMMLGVGTHVAHPIKKYIQNWDTVAIAARTYCSAADLKQISDMRKKINAATDPAEKEKLQKELEAMDAYKKKQRIDAFIQDLNDFKFDKSGDVDADQLALKDLLDKHSLTEWANNNKVYEDSVQRAAFLNYNSREASNFLAQHKRNVSYTAQMQQFQRDMVQGIPDTYNIAIIEDTKAAVYTPSGDSDVQKPFDGATYVNPFVNYLENYSLGANKAGIDKKQFAHGRNAATGTGFILKTAGFSLTNDRIRNNEFYQKMMRNMTNIPWKDHKGNHWVENVFQGMTGESLLPPVVYYKLGDKYFMIDNTDAGNPGIKWDEASKTYTITATEVNQYGATIEGGQEIVKKGVVINTNWKLWKVLGGENSMEMTPKGLKFSETSIEDVVNCMNNTSSIKLTDSNYPNYQHEIYQPLKHSDIHYGATIGAVKQGPANINGTDAYTQTKTEDGTVYNYMILALDNIGIQLDKEHHADHAEVSNMTQVVSAICAKGYLPDEAIDFYNALYSITASETAKFRDEFSGLIDTNSDEGLDALNRAITATIIYATMKDNSEDGSSLRAMAADIIKQVRDPHFDGTDEFWSDAAKSMAFNDVSVYNKVISTLSSILTKKGIKTKVAGTLSVLNPAHGVIKFYEKDLVGYTAAELRAIEAAPHQIQAAYDIAREKHNIKETTLAAFEQKYFENGKLKTYRCQVNELPTTAKLSRKPLVKYYGPTMGKTIAAKTNSNLVDFDDIAREPIRNLAGKLGKTVREVKMDGGDEYKNLLLDLVEKWKAEPSSQGKTLVISNKVLANEDIFDNIPMLPSKEEFVKRQVGRTNDPSKTKQELTAEASQYYDDLIANKSDFVFSDAFVSDIEEAEQLKENAYNEFTADEYIQALNNCSIVNPVLSDRADLKCNKYYQVTFDETKVAAELAQLDIQITNLTNAITLAESNNNKEDVKALNKKLAKVTEYKTKFENLTKSSGWTSIQIEIPTGKFNKSFNGKNIPSLGQKFVKKLFDDGIITSFKLDKAQGKDLESYDVDFKDTKGRRWQLSDLQITEDLFNFKQDSEGYNIADCIAITEKYEGPEQIKALKNFIDKSNVSDDLKNLFRSAPAANTVSQLYYNLLYSDGFKQLSEPDKQVFKDFLFRTDCLFAKMYEEYFQYNMDKRIPTALMFDILLNPSAAISETSESFKNFATYIGSADYNERLEKLGLKQTKEVQDWQLTQPYPEFVTFIKDWTARYLHKQLQNTLFTLSEHNSENYPIYVNTAKGLEQVKVKPDSVKVTEFGLIMPKVHASKFGLRKGDQVGYILSNPDFFKERMIENYSTNIEPTYSYNGSDVTVNHKYDIQFKRSTGEHIQVIKGISNAENAGLKPKTFYTRTEVLDGQTKIIRIDDHNEEMYELSSAQDQIYEDAYGNEFIVIPDKIYYTEVDGQKVYLTFDQINNNVKHTDDGELIYNDSIPVKTEPYNGIQHYIDTLDYSGIYLNNDNDKLTEEAYNFYLQALKASSNKTANIYHSYFSGNFEWDKPLLNYLKNRDSSLESELAPQTLEKISKYFSLKGNQIYAAFKKSLDIIAARIPAQSQQSVMGMKVEGFENNDVNSAYVSVYQFYLQGSDLDIDAVTLQTYDFNDDGTFTGHSPYYNTNSYELMEASDSLPSPTNKVIEEKEVTTLGTFGEILKKYTSIQTTTTEEVETPISVSNFYEEGATVTAKAAWDEFYSNAILQVDGQDIGAGDYVDACLLSLHDQYPSLFTSSYNDQKPDQIYFEVDRYNNILTAESKLKTLETIAKKLESVYSTQAATVRGIVTFVKGQFKKMLEDDKVTIAHVGDSTKSLDTSTEFNQKEGSCFTLNIISKPGQSTNYKVVVDYSSEKSIKTLAKLITEINKNGFDKTTKDTITIGNITINDANVIQDIQQQLIDAFNKHNLYFRKMSSNKKSMIAKNIELARLRRIIVDPVSQQQAQSSVDVVTSPLKALGNTSPNAKRQRMMTPGNFYNMPQAIVENMVGKSGIATSAVALKSLFANTSVYQNILNNGTEQEINDLLFAMEEYNKYRFNDGVFAGKKHKGLVNGFSLKALANNYEGLAYDVKKFLVESLWSNDGALIQSAILGLATDNAKELILAKINAGQACIDMWLAGASFGATTKELYDVLNNPLARRIADLTNSNLYTKDQGRHDVLQVLDMIESHNPYFELKTKYKSSKSYDHLNAVDEVGRQVAEALVNSEDSLFASIADSSTILSKLKEDFEKAKSENPKLKYLTIDATAKATEIQQCSSYLFQQALSQILAPLYNKDESKSQKDKEKEVRANLNKFKNFILNSVRATVSDFDKGFNYVDFPNAVGQCVDDIYKYMDLVVEYTVQKSHGNDVWNIYGKYNKVQDFIKLATIAQEMQYQGRLCKLNKELVNDIDGFESQVALFSDIFIASKKRLRHLDIKTDDLNKETGAEYYNLQRIYGSDAMPQEVYDRPLSFNDEGQLTTDSGLTLDIYKFATDETYANNCIKLYDKCFRVCQNPLKVFKYSPQFKGYFETMVQNHQIHQKNLVKSQAVSMAKKMFCKRTGCSGKQAEKVAKSITSLVDYHIIEQFIQNLPKEYNPVFRMPQNEVVKNFHDDKSDSTNTGLVEVKLGTAQGNASFKKLMEDIIFPMIKEFYFNNQNEIDRDSKNHDSKLMPFMQNFGRTIRMNVNTGIPMRCWGMRIEMMPNPDAEFEVMQTLAVQQAFNYLRVLTASQKGQELAQKLKEYFPSKGNQLSLATDLVDLFYMYNLIAFNNRQASNSMTKLFNKYTEDSKRILPKAYRDTVNAFCHNLSENPEYLAAYAEQLSNNYENIAPIVKTLDLSAGDGRGNIVRCKNPATGQIDVYQKELKPTADFDEEGGENNEYETEDEGGNEFGEDGGYSYTKLDTTGFQKLTDDTTKFTQYGYSPVVPVEYVENTSGIDAAYTRSFTKTGIIRLTDGFDLAITRKPSGTIDIKVEDSSIRLAQNAQQLIKTSSIDNDDIGKAIKVTIDANGISFTSDNTEIAEGTEKGITSELSETKIQSQLNPGSSISFTVTKNLKWVNERDSKGNTRQPYQKAYTRKYPLYGKLERKFDEGEIPQVPEVSIVQGPVETSNQNLNVNQEALQEIFAKLVNSSHQTMFKPEMIQTVVEILKDTLSKQYTPSQQKGNC